MAITPVAAMMITNALKSTMVVHVVVGTVQVELTSILHTVQKRT